MAEITLEGRRYWTQRVSDVINDGMALEMYDAESNEQVLHAIYWDERHTLTFSAYRENLPFSVVEWFMKQARFQLTPLVLDNEEAPSMDEINEIVHEVRRQRKAG